jgi:recombination protein RecR
MTIDSPIIGRLMEALRCLPGVGPKSAQRMAFHLLERNPEGARRLARTLQEAVDKVGRCTECRTLSETSLCRLCAAGNRNPELLCVVENPADVQAIEQTTSYQGLYFVLLGHLSPLDGIGPEQIGLDQLAQRFSRGTVKEVILATNPTMEGEATAHYIADMARQYAIKASRIAYGVPFGGELEYVDSGTLTHALAGRREI